MSCLHNGLTGHLLASPRSLQPQWEEVMSHGNGFHASESERSRRIHTSLVTLVISDTAEYQRAFEARVLQEVDLPAHFHFLESGLFSAPSCEASWRHPTKNANKFRPHLSRGKRLYLAPRGGCNRSDTPLHLLSCTSAPKTLEEESLAYHQAGSPHCTLWVMAPHPDGTSLCCHKTSL